MKFILVRSLFLNFVNCFDKLTITVLVSSTMFLKLNLSFQNKNGRHTFPSTYLSSFLHSTSVARLQIKPHLFLYILPLLAQITSVLSSPRALCKEKFIRKLFQTNCQSWKGNLRKLTGGKPPCNDCGNISDIYATFLLQSLM